MREGREREPSACPPVRYCPSLSPPSTPLTWRRLAQPFIRLHPRPRRQGGELVWGEGGGPAVRGGGRTITLQQGAAAVGGVVHATTTTTQAAQGGFDAHQEGVEDGVQRSRRRAARRGRQRGQGRRHTPGEAAAGTPAGPGGRVVGAGVHAGAVDAHRGGPVGGVRPGGGGPGGGGAGLAHGAVGGPVVASAAMPNRRVWGWGGVGRACEAAARGRRGRPASNHWSNAAVLMGARGPPARPFCRLSTHPQRTRPSTIRRRTVSGGEGRRGGVDGETQRGRRRVRAGVKKTSEGWCFDAFSFCVYLFFRILLFFAEWPPVPLSLSLSGAGTAVLERERLF